MNELFVYNKNDFDHSDYFDGKRYDFPKGEKTLIPAVAAFHMFGYSKPDKTENLVRLGWANLGGDEGAKRLAKFVFTQPVMIEAPADESVEVSDASSEQAAA